MIVVNLFAGAGAGKSTIAAGLQYKLKLKGYNSDLTGEVAKDLVYDESFLEMEDQIHIFGLQNHRVRRLAKKCDIVISESPLLLSALYGHEGPEFKKLVFAEHKAYYSLNYFLQRKDSYFIPIGRVGSLGDAKQKDKELKDLLQESKTSFMAIPSDEGTADFIVKQIESLPSSVVKGSRL